MYLFFPHCPFLQMAKYPQLQIQAAGGNAKLYPPIRVFTRPWHLLLWMRDPEEWINNIATNPWLHQSHNRHRAFQPDPLLFPSTWPPLRVLSCFAVFHAMLTTLYRQNPPDIIPVSMNGGGGGGGYVSTGSIIMRLFGLQHALYDEWYRVFMKEKRVALAIFIHMISFLSLLALFYTVAVVDGISSILLLPSILASLFSGWMNTVLYWERREAKRQGRKTPTTATATATATIK